MNRKLLWFSIAGVVGLLILGVGIYLLRMRSAGPDLPFLTARPSAQGSAPAGSVNSAYDVTPEVQAARERQLKNQGAFKADYQGTWSQAQIDLEAKQDAGRGFRPTSTTP